MHSPQTMKDVTTRTESVAIPLPTGCQRVPWPIVALKISECVHGTTFAKFVDSPSRLVEADACLRIGVSALVVRGGMSPNLWLWVTMNGRIL